MMRRMSLPEVNALDRDAFVARFGGVFEHSPWAAESAWEARPFASADALLEAMLQAVREAPEDRQTALIKAHPDLGSRLAMSDASTREQQGAGLDRLTPAEYGELSALNRSYAAKFGFPFILAVRGKTKEEIVAAMRARVGRSAEEEREEALRQIGRIAAFRIAELVAEDAGPAAGEIGGEAGAAVETAAGTDGSSGAAAGAAGEAIAEDYTVPGSGKPSGRLTTHVLDLHRGRPAAGMRIKLYRMVEGGARELVREMSTNADGRTDEPLLAGEKMRAGLYELLFYAGDYFRETAADAGFLAEVPVRFRIADPGAHYHVPLLAAPGGYSTYRGS